MSVKKGFFRLTLVVSLAAGSAGALLAFFEEIDSAQFDAAEKITLNLPVADIPGNPTYGEQLAYNELKETGVPDKDLAGQGLDVARLRQYSAPAAGKAFDTRRRQIYEEQTAWKTLADNPGIAAAALKYFLLLFAAVWGLYCILYFVITGFTSGGRGRQ
jgi:hypothetical protein